MHCEGSIANRVNDAPANNESFLKKVGVYALSPMVLVVLLVLTGLFVYGMVWASEKAMPWLITASRIGLEVCLFVFAPLCMFRKVRPWAGFGFYISSYVFGTLLFAYSCLVAFYFWGFTGLVIGLVFLGVGVVPVALLAAVLHADWAVLVDVVLGILLAFGLRLLGTWLTTQTEEKEEEEETATASLTQLPPLLELDSPCDDPVQPDTSLETEVQRSTAMMNKSERAKLYLDYLNEEGFRPSVDGDGNITFKVEGEPLYIVIDEKQEDYFELIAFVGKLDKDEIARGVDAANFVTLNARVAKVCVDPEGYVSTSVEMFIKPPEGIKNVFSRALSALRYAAKSFTDRVIAERHAQPAA